MDLASEKGETLPCLTDVSIEALEQMFLNMSMLSLSLPYPPMLYIYVPGCLWCVANRHNKNRVSFFGSLPLIIYLTAQILKIFFSPVLARI